MSKLVIVDYGMGNIMSVAMALRFLGAEYIVSSDADEIKKAGAYILPGVGAFHAAMENLNSRGIVETLSEQVVARKKPFLGICLGLQLLAEDSTEKGFSKGLGWLEGHVDFIEPSVGFRVPHVGWSNVSRVKDSPLFLNMPEELNFYFDHSYRLNCRDEDKLAVCDYGVEIVAAVQKDNIFATQFHPEKSQRNGLKLLRNFLNLI